MGSLPRTLFSLLGAALAGAAGGWLLAGVGGDDPSAGAAAPRKPLYWVAPMDPDYRRDGPGKSPMGMDLVPVFADQSTAEAPGTVRLSPALRHNFAVRTAAVRRGQLARRVDAFGRVAWDEDRLLHVHPRVAGWVERLHVRAAGDPVTRGEPLYDLYSPTLVNAQEELLLAQSRGNPALIAAAIDRLRALQVPAAALAALRDGGPVRQTLTLPAPRSGVLATLDIREGMYVEPALEMMSIGVLDPVWLIAEVFEGEMERVREGTNAKLRFHALPGRQWQAAVDYLYPALDPTTGSARLRLRLENPDRALRPGMLAELRLQPAAGPARLLVPASSLIRLADETRVVRALGDGRFRSVPVTVGRIAGDLAEILDGLREGQRVVVSAQFLIDSESRRRSALARLEVPAKPAPAHVHPGAGEAAGRGRGDD